MKLISDKNCINNKLLYVFVSRNESLFDLFSMLLECFIHSKFVLTQKLCEKTEI